MTSAVSRPSFWDMRQFGTALSGPRAGQRVAINPLITCNDCPACNSGNRGSLEQFASIGALRRLSEREPRELGRAAATGDPEALAVWDRYGSSLGVGITSLVYMFTPQLVLLGGGLAGAAPHFLPALRREVESRVQAVSREGLRIEACALGNGAGRLGAARLALQRLGGMMSDS